MNRILIPSEGPDSWRRFLAQPETQWRTGYSACTIANAWEAASGFPPEVNEILEATLGSTELLLAIPEHKTSLPGGRRESQSDVLAIGRHAGGLVTCTIEGKVRMKRNLGVFANTVARLAGLNWEVEPNDEAAGGKVILVKGRYAANRALVEQLVEEAKAAGNEKIDFLHCVPPSTVADVGGRRRSQLATTLEKLGHETWDAVDEGIRNDFPRSIELFRVLQYESSRGLEGWTTVLEGFDESWRWKYLQEQARHRDARDGGPADPERAAVLAAWRWCMIALTRPIDTLVVCVTKPDGRVAHLLSEAARANRDFVEIIEARK